MPSPRENSGPAETPSRRAPLAARVLATGAGCGYLPWAPGTAGSAAALLVLLLPGGSSPFLLGALALAGLFGGRWAAGLVAAETGDRLTPAAGWFRTAFGRPGGGHPPDPSIVVIDEMVGMWIALIALPPHPGAVIVAFTAFRAFDILKPPPVARLESLPGGWGIMLDDAAAGVYANLAARVTLAVIG